MERVISKYEARLIMAGLGKEREYDMLAHQLLPSLVEQWVAQGVQVSIEHCYVRIQGAYSLKIDCLSPWGRNTITVLLNGDAAMFPIFSQGQLETVVTSKKLRSTLSDMVMRSAQALQQQVALSNPMATDCVSSVCAG